MSVRFFLALAAALALQACASPAPTQSPESTPPPPPGQSLTDLVADADDLTVLASLLSAANLTAPLDTDGPLTVFAPSNEAFAALPAGTVESLLRPERRDELAELLSHHVVPGRVARADLRAGQALRTLNGTSLSVRTRNGQLQIGGSTLAATDVDARNGVLHVTDTVLFP